MTTSTLQVLIAFFEGEMTMVPRNAKWVNVASLEEASKKVVECIDENCLGGRDWFGGIVRDGKTPVAVIQFNGRIDTDLESNIGFLNNAKRLLSKK